jgi:hypothetical protein
MREQAFSPSGELGRCDPRALHYGDYCTRERRGVSSGPLMTSVNNSPSSPAPSGSPSPAAGLIVIGVVLIGLTVGLRAIITTTNKETVREGTSAPKVTKTETPFLSDSLLAALLGLGGVLVVSGAFYNRISKITLPGGAGIELKDIEEAAHAVARAAPARMRKATSDPVEAAALTTAVTQATAAKTAAWRRLAKTDPDALAVLVPGVESAGGETFEFDAVRPTVAEHAASQALDEVLGDPSVVAR